jgi:hypothetical protein
MGHSSDGPADNEFAERECHACRAVCVETSARTARTAPAEHWHHWGKDPALLSSTESKKGRGRHRRQGDKIAHYGGHPWQRHEAGIGFAQGPPCPWFPVQTPPQGAAWEPGSRLFQASSGLLRARMLLAHALHLHQPTHVLLLKPVLDRSRPCAAHPKHRGLRRFAEFDQEPGRDDARAAEPAAAVDDDPLPRHQPAAQVLAGPVPGVFEACVGDAAIHDRQVPPAQARRETRSPRSGTRSSSSSCASIRVTTVLAPQSRSARRSVSRSRSQAPVWAWGSYLPGQKVSPSRPRPTGPRVSICNGWLWLVRAWSWRCLPCSRCTDVQHTRSTGSESEPVLATTEFF